MLYVNPMSQSNFRNSALAPGATAREDEALKQFEQLFLFQMLREMRKTVPDDGLFGESGQKAYFEEMMDDFIAGEMAASGQFGVAKQMASEIHAKENAAKSATAPLPGGGYAWSSTANALEAVTPGIRLPLENKAGITIPDPEDLQFKIDRAGGGIALSRAQRSYAEHQ